MFPAFRMCRALYVLPFLLLVACGPKAPDVSGVKAELPARRFDRDFFAIDTNHTAAGLQALETKYPDFLNFYLDTLLGFGVQRHFSDTAGPIREGVRVLLTHKDYRGLFDTVGRHFPDTKKEEAAITTAYRYFRHYFPDAPEKRPLVFFTSNLSRYSAITYGDLIGVGLDMYLGKNYPYYSSVEIPQYMMGRLSPEYMPADVMISLFRDRYPYNPESHSLIDLMVQRGQELYYLEKVLPGAPDSIRLGYTGTQLKWLEENETQLYHFFTDRKLLHETNMLKVMRYVTEGPREAHMPAEAPGNTGSYIGYRIFKAWMEKQGDLPLAKALEPKNGQEVLQQSGYRPR